MTSPAPKRRRTTPPEQEARNVSPSRRTQTRASYLSPTKASLARFNPNLLPRPISAGSGASRPNSRGERLTRGQQARAFVLGESDQLRDLEQARNETAAEADADAAARTPHGRPPSEKNAGQTGQDGNAEEEAELPTTPSARALEQQDTPRRGILYSSPSKRPPRQKNAAKSSPLKTRAAAPVQEQQGLNEDARENAGVEGAREIDNAPQDPELEKKQREKENLEKQLKALEEDVRRYERAIQGTNKSVAEKGPSDIDMKDLISLVESADASNASTDANTVPTPILSLLSSFLPFAKPSIQPAKPDPSSEEPVPSHKPLELDDPLPYLRLFTPFTYSSSISIPGLTSFPPAPSRLHQIHTVDIVDPAKLLNMTIVITIDTSSQKVVSLTIPRLSEWAEYELGTWVRETAKENDVGTLCWALNSYWDLAVRRAEIWMRCEDAFKHVLRGAKKTNQEEDRSRSSKGKRRGQVEEYTEGGDHEEGEDGEEVSGVAADAERSEQSEKRKMTRMQLHRHLGREFLIFENTEVMLKISWRIRFDWTGEAESEVHASAAFPRIWHEADGAKSLKKVTATFDSLVKDRGIFEAIKAMVGLLFS